MKVVVKINFGTPSSRRALIKKNIHVTLTLVRVNFKKIVFFKNVVHMYETHSFHFAFLATPLRDVERW